MARMAVVSIAHPVSQADGRVDYALARALPIGVFQVAVVTRGGIRQEGDRGAQQGNRCEDLQQGSDHAADMAGNY